MNLGEENWTAARNLLSKSQLPHAAPNRPSSQIGLLVKFLLPVQRTYRPELGRFLFLLLFVAFFLSAPKKIAESE